MKKILFKGLFAILLLVVAVGNAKGQTVDGITYSIYNGYAIVTNTGSIDYVVIPEQVEINGNNYNVQELDPTSISSSAITLFINKNITDIATSTFSNASNLKAIYTDEENIYYTTIDDVLFEKLNNNLELICYPHSKENTEYTLPSNVTRINNETFLSSNIKTFIFEGNKIPTILTPHTNTFKNLDNCILKVNDDLITTFKYTSPWTKFDKVFSNTIDFNNYIITLDEGQHLYDITYVDDIEFIINIKVNGNLNNLDIRTLRNMSGIDASGSSTNGRLKSIDLSGANIYDDTSLGRNDYYYFSNGIRYVVSDNYFGEYTFLNTNLETIILPAGITSFSENMFDGCSNLHTIEIVGATTSGNYPTFTNWLNSNTENNKKLIIRNVTTQPSGIADNIIFSNANNNTSVLNLENRKNFEYINEFNVNEVVFSKEFGKEAPIIMAEAGGWETIILPFKPTRIEGYVKDIYGQDSLVTLKPFGSTGVAGKDFNPFWLRELTNSSTTPFNSVRFDGIEANKPYIISMPNNDELYHRIYNISGTVTFYGNGLNYTNLLSPVSIVGSDYNLTSSYTNQSNTVGAYNLDSDGSYFVQSSNIYAFEPYVTIQTPTQLAVKSFGIARPSVPSGLEEIMKNGGVDKNVNIYRTYDGVNISVEKDCKVAIYTIDGRLVNIINAVEGDNYVELQKGIYIIDREKFVL